MGRFVNKVKDLLFYEILIVLSVKFVIYVNVSARWYFSF